MSTQSILTKLGYQETDRLVIIHADDVGMCHATLKAFDDLWNFGTVTSGATMVPCPWFPAVAEYCRKNPEADMGVHATLNSEWSVYRWGALSTVDQTTGLIDQDGYLHRSTDATIKHASQEAVDAEIKAQIEKAVHSGINITHVDSHMGTVFAPKFLESYIQHAIAHAVPPMQPRVDAVGVESMGVSEEDKKILSPLLEKLENQGIPLIDGIMMMPLHNPNNQLEAVKEMLSKVPAGITHFILHPAVDTPELRALSPDWESRVANYETLMNPKFKELIKNEGIKLIGFKALRDYMRGENANN